MGLWLTIPYVIQSTRFHTANRKRRTPPTVFAVSKKSVYKKLIKFNSSKAHDPDDTPGWVLKENADILAEPIADILLMVTALVSELSYLTVEKHLIS